MAVEPHDPRSSAAQQKAAVLREALPWITRFHGHTVVVKYGGSAMVDEQLKASFAADIALLHFVGLRPIVVHGGGPQISETAAAFGVESTFIAGLRVTDESMMDVVRMTLLGKVNPEVVSLIQQAGAPAVGISGIDADLLRVRAARGPDGEDLGLVGEVSGVNVRVLENLLDDGLLPVVATIGRDEHGQDHNVNADLAAGAIAGALAASKLVYLTDVPGLYLDFGDEGSLVSEVSVGRLREMLAEDSLHEGMRPKVQSIVGALEQGVERAHILDGRVLHAVLLEIFTDEGVGTMVSATVEEPGGVLLETAHLQDAS
ncbi:MAG: acetylglutamate kinase [Nitriliruptorales bacterium]|nr:acetylglutamate kinase [Nitriliruptorales bacterium]